MELVEKDVWVFYYYSKHELVGFSEGISSKISMKSVGRMFLLLVLFYKKLLLLLLLHAPFKIEILQVSTESNYCVSFKKFFYYSFITTVKDW